MIDHFP